MSRRGYEGNETITSPMVKGIEVDIVGCFSKDTPEGDYDFYDLYVDGECINLGEPLYEWPMKSDIEAFLELQEALMED